MSIHDAEYTMTGTSWKSEGEIDIKKGLRIISSAGQSRSRWLDGISELQRLRIKSTVVDSQK